MAKLGSNFDSIFDDVMGDNADDSRVIEILKLSEIESNRAQPRKRFDTEKLTSLAQSITEHGVIQPLTVRKLDSGAYQIVAGERRFRAAKIAGLREVPVRVMELSDIAATQIALIENLQREDLDPIEEANGYNDLIEKYGMTQDEAAKRVGKARSSVTNALRLLLLPEKLREYAALGKLSRGHCKVLLSVQDADVMEELGQRVIEQDMSVRALERAVTALAKVDKAGKETDAATTPAPKRKRSRFFEEAETQLSEIVGRAVRIDEGGKSGKNTLCIEFADETDLKEIMRYFGD